VTLVSDACLSRSAAQHAELLAALAQQGRCWLRTAEELLREIARAAPLSPPPHAAAAAESGAESVDDDPRLNPDLPSEVEHKVRRRPGRKRRSGAGGADEAGEGAGGEAREEAEGEEAQVAEEGEEAPARRRKRVAWIQYYVGLGMTQKAYALGWDGEPFAMEEAEAGEAEGGEEDEDEEEESEEEGEEEEGEEEPEADRLKRIEWIKYYVASGLPDNAYALGWDGVPFAIVGSERI